ncbi:hypothetical protein A3Q56_06064 [Intoshia linei]|uniref:Splicing factor Cactin n=1 Tax=Intoshia linei TaxID=1819745 RepID=A0A177AVY8_9BILA|nr:hypothetical protein A3Q56_06064 [Intoshia linei]
MIRRTGIHSSVEDEVSKIFEGKSLNALEMLREQIIQKLDSQAKIDRAYWERLLQKLKENVARQKLCQIHSLILSINATKIKVESLPISRNMKEKFDQYEAYKNGRYSPALIDFDSVPQVAKVVSETYDKKVIDSERSKIFEKFKNVVKSEEIYERMLQEAREGMNEHEMEFKDTVNIESNSSMTLKKPRFFNRINAGFDWNKYNQAHYDVDNPPPKVVLGYKFSIFYPDLLDPSKTPSYTLKPYPVDKDFSILTFNASAPYEDIAFKIVNREWETSSKYGFRGKFQDGIFQLWFHFKRYRYRR